MRHRVGRAARRWNPQPAVARAEAAAGAAAPRACARRGASPACAWRGASPASGAWRAAV